MIFASTNSFGSGPSKQLLGVIEEHHGEAPEHWPGYRDEGGGH